MSVSYFSIIKYLWLTLLLITGIWCIGALHYTVSWYPYTKYPGMFLFAAVVIFLLILGIRGNMTATLDLLILELLVIYHFLWLSPQELFSNTRWQAPWGRRPYITFNGSRATIHHVRDFHYYSEHEYDVHYRTLTVDMDKVIHVDLAVSHWDGLNSIAHTMLTFIFSDGQHIAFSMETRLPEGVEQNAIAGLYKQYELLPVIATETDLYKLRTNFRKEELYLYRTNATAAQARLMLEKLLYSINEQYNNPRFYNSLTHNCTTSLAPMLRWINPDFSGDIRLLINGYSDELLYDLGYLACKEGESFPELKARRKANLYLDRDEDYSTAIRTNL
ncbi:MAG: DUF4105 domain-containing protein [Lentisphaerae bacterium]|nr:DUF4105 domain-containing protein [Lentisphaerota bacterium]